MWSNTISQPDIGIDNNRTMSMFNLLECVNRCAATQHTVNTDTDRKPISNIKLKCM